MAAAWVGAGWRVFDGAGWHMRQPSQRRAYPWRIVMSRITAHTVKLGFHLRGKRKRLAAAACGYGMRYANDLIPYIRLPMRLHSLFLSEWKETPNYDVIFTDSQLPPSDFVPFAAWIATWSDSVCRIRSHSQPHDKSHAVSGHMESPSSVYKLFHFCRITHNACRLRLPRIWNPSFRRESVYVGNPVHHNGGPMRGNIFQYKHHMTPINYLSYHAQ